MVGFFSESSHFSQHSKLCKNCRGNSYDQLLNLFRKEFFVTFGSEPTLFAVVIVKSNRDLSSNSFLSNQEKNLSSV